MDSSALADSLLKESSISDVSHQKISAAASNRFFSLNTDLKTTGDS
jgi:hypothetical protein